ncbi:MAG: hypothetical protein CVU89_12845 [Firmicutes bacterium HGW-Firmicutes-14]|nr:MAG: hypothetical protein CVU89_12845 [Firmicutes bacterium HGW-Firmicutes-14]
MKLNVPEYGFPTRYDENFLVLLVRDPHCIYAYWEFSDEQMELIAEELGVTWGQVPLTLRLYDLTGINDDKGSAHSCFDFTVHSLANHYYIKDLDENSSFRVDLGILTKDGLFVALLRSNIVRTPRESPADGSGVMWADLLERLVSRQEKPKSETFSSEGVYGAEIREPDREEG